MLVSNSNYEYPDIPFIYDIDTMTCYPVIFCGNAEIKKNTKFFDKIKNIIDVNKIKKHIFVIVQSLNKQCEVYVSYHTWLLKQLNIHTSIIPKNITILSKFKAGVYPISTSISQMTSSGTLSVKTQNGIRTIRYGMGVNKQTNEFAKIENYDTIKLLPTNSCNFYIDANNYPVNMFLTMIENPTICVQDNTNTSNTTINTCELTLHIIIDHNNCKNIDDVFNYLKNVYGICVR